jgi:serine/threonine protein kinase
MIDAHYIGQQFGCYTIIEAINSGTFGSVFKARHVYLKNRPIVAVKILHFHLASREERERFIGEAQLLSELAHPYILPIIDAGFQNGIPFMIVEYAAGGTLRDRIRRQAGQPFAVDEAARIITQIGEALHYAHSHEKHIVHRDLKPENILFNASGNALLGDFGIAAILETTGTKMLERSGTPAYMAPEQFEGIASTRGDQYALGCIAYELLTGRRPYHLDGANIFAVQYQHAKVEPDPPTTYNPRIPAHVERAIRIAMSKDRADRYPDVAAFLDALAAPSAEPLAPLYRQSSSLRCVTCGAVIRPDARSCWQCRAALWPSDSDYRRRPARPPAKTEQQWLVEGNVYYNSGRFEKALAAYEQAVRLNPGAAIAYSNKGNALSGLKRYNEALAAYDQAIHLDPAFATAYFNKGLTLIELKRSKESLEPIEQALNLDPNNSRAYLDELKRYKEALASYEQALRLDPSSSTLLRPMAIRVISNPVE